MSGGGLVDEDSWKKVTSVNKIQ